MGLKNYYDTLDVGRDATPAEIKRAFRQLAKKWHPDCNVAANAKATFQYLNEAYACLTDPLARRDYDRKLKAKEASPKAERPKSDPPKPKPKPESSTRKEAPPEPPRAHPMAQSATPPPPYVLFVCALAALISAPWVMSGPVVSAPTTQETTVRQAKLDETGTRETEARETQRQEEARRAAEQERIEWERVRERARLEQEALGQQLARRAAEEQSKAERDRVERERMEREAAERERVRLEEARREELRRQEEARRAAEEREKAERERAEAEQMARWDGVANRMFDGRLRIGSPCELPLLQGQRCYDVQLNAPQGVSFKIAGQPNTRREFTQRVEVSITGDEGRLTIVRPQAFAPFPFFFIPPGGFAALEPQIRYASLHLLWRFGFTPEMLQHCENGGSSRFASRDREYRCMTRPPQEARPVRQEFSARPRPAPKSR
jgi:curved DNA-binding protein CbpA